MLRREERVLTGTHESMPMRVADSVGQDRRGTRERERKKERERARNIRRKVAVVCAYVRMRYGPS